VSVDADELREQLPEFRQHLAVFGDRLPSEIHAQLDAVERRLDALQGS